MQRDAVGNQLVASGGVIAIAAYTTFGIAREEEVGSAHTGRCALLARELGVAPRDVAIVRGGKSSLKQVRVVMR